MRLAVLSDIHGNAVALKAILEDCKKYNIDGYLLLGDYFDAGPQPLEVFDIINELDSTIIIGNHDIDLRLYKEGKMDIWNKSCLYDSVLWTYKKLDKNIFDFIDSYPIACTYTINGFTNICLAHGTPNSAYEGTSIQNDHMQLDKIFDGIDQNILICGHTHSPGVISRGEYLYLNPGSAGQPHGKEAEYMIVDTDGIDIKHKHIKISYDIDEVILAYKMSGLLEEGGICAKMNMLGFETGKVYYFEFKKYTINYAKQLGIHDINEITDEMWLEASRKWDWIV